MTLAQAAPGRAFPEALETAIHTVLSIKPAERQPSAAAFAREITAAAGLTFTSGTFQGPGTLPPTVIAPAGIGAATATGTRATQPATGDATTPRRRRPALYVGAGVAAAVLVGGIAWWVRPTAGRAHAGVAEPVTSAQPPANAAAAPATPPATSPPATAKDAGPVAATTPSQPAGVATEHRAAPQPRPSPPARPDTTPHVAGRPLGAPASGHTAATGDTAPAAAASRPQLTPEQLARVKDAHDVAFRLFDRLQPGLPPATILAIRDTARQIAEENGAGPKNRGLAAYVVANTFIDLHGRNDNIVRWLQRAVDFGYKPAQTQLDYYRSQAP